jgi:hypothetical protein
MTPHLGLGVFHSDATCRLEALVCGVLLLRLSRGLSGLNTTRDNSMVLRSHPFSNGRMVASLVLARITRDQRGSPVRPGTSSAGAVCRAAELQANHERSPQIPR